jgi:hypothetical protein
MNRWIWGLTLAVLCASAQTATAQVYAYGAPTAVYVPRTVYAPPVAIAAPVVTSAYYTPAYALPAYSPAYVAPSPVVQMAYAAPVVVNGTTSIPVAGGVVRQTTRGGPYNFTQTTRTYGAVDAPRYSRVHVHRGLFGATTVRERVR